ncbi:uncharacterized protein LOC141902346 isoform X2 [Tubulanus polymorphus]
MEECEGIDIEGQPSSSIECSTRESRYFTSSFIDLYRELECLWNLNIPECKSKTERAKAYQLLCQRFDMDERDVKAKISSLRTYYSKELAKHRRSSAKGEVYVSKWPHSSQLDFLTDFIVPRGQMRVRHFSKRRITVENDSDQLDDALRTIMDDQNSEINSEINNHHSPRKRIKLSTPEVHSFSASPMLTATRQVNSGKEDKLLQATANLLKVSENSMFHNDDPDALFGRHIANELRAIDDDRIKKMAKMKIQNAIFEAQYNSS